MYNLVNLLKEQSVILVARSLADKTANCELGLYKCVFTASLLVCVCDIVSMIKNMYHHMKDSTEAIIWSKLPI